MEETTGVMVNTLGSCNWIEFNATETTSSENNVAVSIQLTTPKVSSPLPTDEESKENISYIFVYDSSFS